MEEYQSLGGSSLPTRTRGLGETSMRRGCSVFGPSISLSRQGGS